MAVWSSLYNYFGLFYGQDLFEFVKLRVHVIVTAKNSAVVETEISHSDLLLSELVSTKGSNTGFDATSAQSNEEESHHG